MKMKSILLVFILFASFFPLFAEGDAVKNAVTENRNYSLKARIINIEVVTKVDGTMTERKAFKEDTKATIVMYPHFSIVYLPESHFMVKNSDINSRTIKLSEMEFGDLVGELTYGKD